MLELSQDNLKEVISQNEKVVVQYGATWCGNCKIVKPKFKKLADEMQDITFVYVDAEKYPESRGLASVKNLPTFASFKNGEIVNQAMGNKIEKVKELADEIANN
jgi:thioredoxin 1